jgi:hypothetical protein
MAAKQNFFGLVDAGREIRRAPLVGVQFLHESPVRAPYLERARTWFKTEDLQRLFFGHRAAARRLAKPRTVVFLDVFTPAGLPAVEISFE